jgi:hypothetical protein
MAKTTLSVAIHYDARRTDPESLASAMDRLLETALTIADILDEYGNPKVGRFFVVRPASANEQHYALRIDGGLLRQQRSLLLTLADSVRQGAISIPEAQAEGLLEGVLSLLDEIADQAHDHFGIDCLLKDPHEAAQDRAAGPENPQQ